MKWLLEEDIFEENLEELQKEIVKQGGSFEFTKYKPFDENLHIGSIYHFADNVFFYGTLNLCKIIQDNTCWTTYCNFPAYECDFYYPRFGDHLVNQDFIILPFGSVTPRIFDIFNKGVVFWRPCGGSKAFSGQCIGANSFENQYFAAKQDMKPEDLVLISSYKNVGKEWRLLVSGEKVVTGSQYKDFGEFKTGPLPLNVIKYAQDLLPLVDYNPDPMWTLDICDYEDQLYVLEVGGSSCAGLYDSDMSKFVNKVHELGIEPECMKK